MPKLEIIEEFDILTELQSPDFIYSTEKLEEKIAFCKYINSISSHRILLLNSELFNSPFTIGGLKEEQVESILKDGDIKLKRKIFSNFFNIEFFKKVTDFITELDNRQKTTENTTRIKNIIQYLKDNKNII